MQQRHIIIIIAALISSGFLASCAKEPPYTGGGAKEELKRCLTLSAKKKYEKAVDCLEILKSRYPRSAEGEEAELKIADMHYNQKEYLLAAESYNGFLKLYPRSSRADYAHYRAGLSYFRESPKAIDRDQEYLDDSISHLTRVITYYPQSAYRSLSARFLKEARKRVARRYFYVGRFYYRTKEYIAAIPRLREVATEYIDSGLGPRSLYLMTLASIRLDDLESAKGTFGMMSTDYPKNRLTKKAEKKLLKASQKEAKRGK